MSIKRGRKSKRNNRTLVKVARTVGSTLGTIVAEAELLGRKSRKIGAQAGALARRTRKRTASVLHRRGSRRRRRS